VSYSGCQKYVPFAAIFLIINGSKRNIFLTTTITAATSHENELHVWILFADTLYDVQAAKRPFRASQAR
jgi:hypothetical protein